MEGIEVTTYKPFMHLERRTTMLIGAKTGQNDLRRKSF